LSIWRFVTDFGDTAVTVPLAALMLFFLAVARQPRLALAWAFAILGCAGMIGGLKLVLDACSNPAVAAAGLASPSGHTAMSAAVYGGFAAVIAGQLARPARAALMIGATALIIAIPMSRIALHLHTGIEVAVGLVVGLVAVAIIIAAVAMWRDRLPILWLAGAAIVLAMVLHGERWPAEQAVRHLAGWLEILRPWCG
jgi:membrane-associated phospholipid phosphatase